MTTFAPPPRAGKGSPALDATALEFTPMGNGEPAAENGYELDNGHATDASKGKGKGKGRRKNQQAWLDPTTFPGEWKDSLGHEIVLFPKGASQSNFIAMLTRSAAPGKIISQKRLAMNYDKTVRSWICGNGVLQKDRCTDTELIFRTVDGRESKWTRLPPSGPVYFDLPQFGTQLSADAPEFVPDDEAEDDDEEEEVAQPAVAGTPMLKPTPQVAPARAPVLAAEPAPLLIRLAASDPTMTLDSSGTVLTWKLSEPWSDLKDFVKGFARPSPSFELPDKDMAQLQFYPSGVKGVKDGLCTVALERTLGTASGQGVKFQLSINDKVKGNKVCLGQRFSQDFPRPEDNEKTVEVTFQLLAVVGR